MMSSGMVVPIAVEDVSVETVLISNILDGSHIATGFLQGVLAHNLVPVTGLLLSM
jgi:hypothetical protein